jgi:hypothetical protein
MVKEKKIQFFSILIILLLLFSSFIPISSHIVYAEDVEIEYSNVLYDLKKDDSFNESQYSKNETYYSISIIQIAESVNEELFVYVYQPCSDSRLNATSINMATDIDEDNTYTNYKLQLLNSNDCLYKYKVLDLIVSEDTTRSYEISSIFRNYVADYDDISSDVTEFSFGVGKKYIFTNTDTGVDVTVTDVELITVDDKYVGFVRYDGKSNFWGSNWKCDSHFIAFRTDKKIDTLLTADVYFVSNEVYWCYNGYTIYGNDDTTITGHCDDSKMIDEVLDVRYKPVEHYETLNYTQKVNYASGKWSYEWQRIQTIDEFIQNEKLDNIYENSLIRVGQYNDLTEQAKANLNEMQWVLRFYETEYKFTSGWYGGSYNYTVVYDVSILRLEFETDSCVYNLGVIDNKQYEDDTPANSVETTVEFTLFENLFNWVKQFFNSLGIWLKVIFIVFLVLLGLFVLALLIYLFSKIVKVVFSPFKRRKNRR